MQKPHYSAAPLHRPGGALDEQVKDLGLHCTHTPASVSTHYSPKGDLTAIKCKRSPSLWLFLMLCTAWTMGLLSRCPWPQPCPRPCAGTNQPGAQLYRRMAGAPDAAAPFGGFRPAGYWAWILNQSSPPSTFSGVNRSGA